MNNFEYNDTDLEKSMNTLNTDYLKDENDKKDSNNVKK